MIINKYTGETKTYRVLDKDGNLIDPKYTLPLSQEEIERSYYVMLLSRILDTRMLKMQRQGRMLTFPPNMGEEALQVGTSLNIQKGDWFVPAFRSGAVYLHQNVPILNILLVWRGNELGNKMPTDKNLLPYCITIGTQYSHAAGIGYALNYENKKNASFTFIGDGGTSEGEFYEALNFGALLGSQTVFCINNNQWAISTPTSKESAVKDLTQKAIGAGIAYIKVDGNDLFASYEAVKAAREYTIANKAPILIEFESYRMGPHTTSDNPRVYRTEEYEKEQEKKDPLFRLETFLTKKGWLSATKKSQMEEKINAEIDQAIKQLDNHMTVSVDEVFDYTFEKLDEDLLEQKRIALAENK